MIRPMSCSVDQTLCFDSRRMIIAVVIPGSVMIFSLAFQNCENVSFSGVGGATNAESVQQEDCTVAPNGCSTTTPVSLVAPLPSATPIGCQEGQANVGGLCQVTSFKECQVFLELDTTSNPIEIPSLESSGKCYYKKMIDAEAPHKSGAFSELRAADVLARDHTQTTSDGRSPLQPANPFVLGDKTFNILLHGGRTISLSSTPSADVQTSKLKIDNFFLVETYAQGGVAQSMLARGTADAEPFANSNKNSTGPILVNGRPVHDFISYASGGSALVGYIDVSSGFIIDVPTKMRVRQLDCGGTAVASDVYIIVH